MLICCITSLTQIGSHGAEELSDERRLLGEAEEEPDEKMNSSDIFARVFVIISAIILISLPVAIFWIIYNNFENLEDPEITEKYGFLYEGLSTKTLAQSLYHLAYIFRRTLFVIILIFLADYNGIQLICQVQLTLFYAIYFGGTKPFKVNANN